MRRLYITYLLLTALFVSLLFGCHAPANDIPESVTVFTASWCNACRHDTPTLEEIEGEGFVVHLIDCDTRPDLIEHYQISQLPTYLVYDSQGKLAERTGNVRKVLQVLRLLRSLR